MILSDKVDKVAAMVADMEVDKVANMEVDVVTNMEVDTILTRIHSVSECSNSVRELVTGV